MVFFFTIRPYRTRRILSIIPSAWMMMMMMVVVKLFCCYYFFIPTIVRTTAISSIPQQQQQRLLLLSTTQHVYENRHLTMNHHRHIEEEEEEEEMSIENDDNDDDTTFLYNDLSTYSIRYEKCQFVKMYDDELASNQAAQQYASSSSSSSPLATKHFVIYRLCPTDTCSSSTSTSTHNACGTEDSTVPFGTYTMTVEEYLYYTITYQKQVLEESCNFCNAYCLSTSSSSSSSSSSSYYCTSDCTNTMCHSCSTTCDDYQAYTTAIVNGVTNIVDAANYIQCQKLELSNNNNNNNNAAVDDNVNNNEAQDNNNNDDDNDNNIAIQYYIGPYCQSVHTTSTNTAPTSISIGLFSDENCYSPITNINMTEVLGGITLSYHLFKHTTSTSSLSTSSSSSSKTKNPMQCLSCLETMNNNNNNDMNDVDDVNEMCENLYTVSAKCESTTGLQYGFIQMHRNNNNNNNNDENENEQKNKNNNQVENEFMVCTFIQSLLYNSYTQTGIIDIRVPQDYIIRTLTRRQGNTLILLSFILVSMIGAIYYYHTKIQQQQQLIHPSIIMTTTTKTTNRNQKMLLIRDGEMS